MKFTFRKKKITKSPSPEKKVMMESFFDDFRASQTKSNIVRDKFDTTSFTLNVADDGDYYTVTAELPGVKEKNIDIFYEVPYLTISACKKSEAVKKSIGFLKKESSFGRVSRRIKLDPLEPSSMKVTFENGILSIRMNKIGNNEVMK